MTFKIPVDFIIEAESGEAAELALQEFIEQAVFAHRLTFGLVNWDIPYGFKEED